MCDLMTVLLFGFMIIGVLAICFLIFTQWVEFTSDNLKYMKLLEYLRFINKFSLYFLIATIIINIVFYTIMFDSGSGIKSIQ